MFLSLNLIFLSQKDVRLNTTHYFIIKINNKRELQTIAVNYCADIHYQDFKKIYREWTKESHNFLTIDNTLPASDPLRFRKKMFHFYVFKLVAKQRIKMTITDQIKILNRKIMQNEAQYDLDRKAELSSNNLDKYEYLTGEDLGLNPSTVEQVKFEYSPLSKTFNRGLDKDDKKKDCLRD